MAELETVQTVPENQPLPETEPTKTEKFKAGVKEWFRKFIVKLKHKTHMIPLVVLLISSLTYLCILNSLSIVIDKNSGIESVGICVFVNTLASVLILLMFLNAFPKRKKPNIVMIVGVFLVMAVLIALDVLVYVNTIKFIKIAYKSTNIAYLEATFKACKGLGAALNNLIIHAVFVGIAFLALAFLPLYKMGIKKINTKKVIAENVIKEEIDTSAEV
ncbi:MAG: hypothetical protein K2L67_00250 [Clostridia bacterium]|nr:hypothetical protein [Clostridia bacterium]